MATKKKPAAKKPAAKKPAAKQAKLSKKNCKNVKKVCPSNIKTEDCIKMRKNC